VSRHAVSCKIVSCLVSSHQKEFIGSSVVIDDRSGIDVAVVSPGRQFDRDPPVSPPVHGANPGFVGAPRDENFAVLPQIGGQVAEGGG
jgi:hypothetical protein